MSGQNRLPHHPGILLDGQQRTGVNEVHAYEVLHTPTILRSPVFLSGTRDALATNRLRLLFRAVLTENDAPRIELSRI